MDPILNPYSPGAGALPPELAGRDELITKASVALMRIASGRFGKSLILTGLRGVGKTVLLNRIRQSAEAAHLISIRCEVSEGRSLPSLLVTGLKSALLKLNKGKHAANLVLRALKVLSGFVKAMKIKYGDVELTVDVEPEENFTGLELEESLIQLFQAVGLAAKEKKTAIVLFLDEIQVLEEQQLASLIMALHLCVQDALPITLVAAGLPQILAKMGRAKTYAERLFEFVNIGKLEEQAALQALIVPAKRLKVNFTKEASQEILKQTQGYPYFLQEWGKQAWDIAQYSPITLQDAKKATVRALNDLDESFFRMRFDQLTQSQKKYLRAMAELGSGPHTSGEIAGVLTKKVTELAPIRDQLINKGIIYSPSHGETAFTVPLFDRFMKRMMK